MRNRRPVLPAARSARLRGLLAAALLAGSNEVRAVSPLVVDDADTVSRGKLQLNAVWQLGSASGTSLTLVPVNAVFGVSDRGEAGLLFGYIRRDVEGVAAASADGPTDVVLSTKWKLWEATDELTVSGRLDVKLPAASETRGLGSGDTDVGGVLLLTRCWGRTCLDWNVGYVADDVSHSDFGDDSWFLGQAVRHDLDGPWCLLAEIYGGLPNGGRASPSRAQYRVGAQFTAGTWLLVSALVGSGFGSGPAGVTGTVGLSWLF